MFDCNRLSNLGDQLADLSIFNGLQNARERPIGWHTMISTRALSLLLYAPDTEIVIWILVVQEYVRQSMPYFSSQGIVNFVFNMRRGSSSFNWTAGG